MLIFRRETIDSSDDSLQRVTRLSGPLQSLVDVADLQLARNHGSLHP